MIDNPNAPFMFIVDTEQYAGNFERKMTAYMTGRYGECGVGAEEARIFYQEMGLIDGQDKKFSDYEDGDWRGIDLQTSNEDFDNPFIWIIELPDEHGCRRPVTIYPTPGWFNHGMGGHFREGDEEAALESYKEECLKQAEYKGVHPNDKERHKKRWTDKAEKAVLSKHPSYQSVAILMEKPPTTEQIAILKERANKFVEYYKDHLDEKEISITGFRLVKTEVKRIKTEMLI